MNSPPTRPPRSLRDHAPPAPRQSRPPARGAAVAGPIFAALVLAALVLLVPTAHANATLVAGEPLPDGSAAENSTRIVLHFSERLDTSVTDANLFDLTGQSWRDGAPTVDGMRLELPVHPLAQGSYSVAWRTLAADGHTTRGTHYLHVGDPQVAPSGSTPRPEQETYGAHGAESLTRAAHAALATLALALAAAPRLASPGAADLAWTRKAAAAFATVAAMAAGLGLVYLGDRTGLPTLAVALDTQAGGGFALRTVLLAGAAVALTRAGPRGPALALLVGAAGSLAISTHAGLGGASRLVATSGELAFLGGAAVLLALAVQAPQGLTASPRRVKQALGAALLGAAVAALAHVPDLRAAWATPYVRTLALELVLLLAIALAMARHLRPQASPAVGAGAATRQTLPGVLALAALLVAGGLGAAVPPLPAAATADVPTPLVLDAYADRVHVLVTLTPMPEVGKATDLDVALHPLVRDAVTNATTLHASLHPPGVADAPPVPLERDALTQWRLDDLRLDTAGTWILQLRIEHPGAADQELSFPFPVPVPPGEST